MAKSIMQGSGARGTKTLVSTGLDTSSYGSRGTEGLGSKAKGSVADLSNSVSGGKVPSR